MSNGAGRLVGAATAGLMKDSVQRWVNSIVQADGLSQKANTDREVDGPAATDLADTAAVLDRPTLVEAVASAIQDRTAAAAAAADDAAGLERHNELDDLTLGADAVCISGAETGIQARPTSGSISVSAEENMKKKVRSALPLLLMTEQGGGGGYYGDIGRRYSAAEILRQRFGNQQQDSCVSDCSNLTTDSLSSLLDRRKEDPEQILENMGFGGNEDSSNRRIPDRFLQNPSRAAGISVEKYLDDNPELKAYWEEKNARENPFEIVFNQSASQETTGSGGGSSPRPPSSPGTDFYNIAQRMTLINKFKNLAQRARAGDDLRGIPTAEPVLRVTPSGRKYWSILAAENCHYLEGMGFYDVMNYRLPKSDEGRMKVVVDQFKSSLAKTTAPRSCSSQLNPAADGTSETSTVSSNAPLLSGKTTQFSDRVGKLTADSRNRIENPEVMDTSSAIKVSSAAMLNTQSAPDLAFFSQSSSNISNGLHILTTDSDSVSERTSTKASSPVKAKFRQKCLEKLSNKKRKSDDTSNASMANIGEGTEPNSNLGTVLRVPGGRWGALGRRRCPSDSNLYLNFSSSTDENDSPVAGTESHHRAPFHGLHKSGNFTNHKDVNDNQVPSIRVGMAKVAKRRPRARSSDPIRTQRSKVPRPETYSNCTLSSEAESVQYPIRKQRSKVQRSDIESDWTPTSEAESVEYEWNRTSGGSTSTTTDDDEDDLRWSRYTSRIGQPFHQNVSEGTGNLCDIQGIPPLGNPYIGEISSFGDDNEVEFSLAVGGSSGSNAWLPDEVVEDREGGLLLMVPGMSDTASNASSSRTLLQDGDQLSDVDASMTTGDVVTGVARGRRIGSEENGGDRDSFERTPSFRCARDFSASIEDEVDTRYSQIVIEPATPDDGDERGLDRGRGQECRGLTPPSKPRRGVLEVVQSFDFEEIESQTDSLPSNGNTDRKKGRLRRDEGGSMESDSSGFADTDLTDGLLLHSSTSHATCQTGSNQLHAAERWRHGDDLLPSNRAVSLRRQLARSATEELDATGCVGEIELRVGARPLSAIQLNQYEVSEWDHSGDSVPSTGTTATSINPATTAAFATLTANPASRETATIKQKASPLDDDTFSPVSTYRTSLYIDSRSQSMPHVALEPGQAEVMLFVGGEPGYKGPTHEVRIGPPAPSRGCNSLTSMDSVDSRPELIRFSSIDVEVEDFRDGQQRLRPVAYTTGARQKSWEPLRNPTGITSSIPTSLNRVSWEPTSLPGEINSLPGTAGSRLDSLNEVPLTQGLGVMEDILNRGSARKQGHRKTLSDWREKKEPRINATDHVILYNLLSRSIYTSPQSLSCLTHPINWYLRNTVYEKEFQMSPFIEELELFQQAVMKYKVENRALKLRSQSLCNHCNLTASSTLPEDRHNISAVCDLQRDIARQCKDLDLAISQKMRDTVACCMVEEREQSSRSLADLGIVALMIELLREQTYHSNITSGVSDLIFTSAFHHSSGPDRANTIRLSAPRKSSNNCDIGEPYSADRIRSPFRSKSFNQYGSKEADYEKSVRLTASERAFTFYDIGESDSDRVVCNPALEKDSVYYYSREPDGNEIVRRPSIKTPSNRGIGKTDQIICNPALERASTYSYGGELDETMRHPIHKINSAPPTSSGGASGRNCRSFGGLTSPLLSPASATALLERFNSLEQKVEELRTSSSTLQQFQDSVVEEIRQSKPSIIRNSYEQQN